MKQDVVYLTLQQVLKLHQQVVQQTGGSDGLRDKALLDSAIAQPAMAGFGQELHPDLPSKAAAYLFHLCKNHPFEDGNKRTSFACAAVFLLLNGYVLTGTTDELEQFVLGVADGSISKEQTITFIRNHVARRHDSTS